MVQNKSEKNLTFVLVHGAWAGSWVWKKIIPILESLGHRVIAVDLPGNGTDRTPPSEIGGFSDYTHYLCGVVDALDGSIVLAGHSGAGLIISQVAELRPTKVARLIYIAGFLLPSDMSYRDFCIKYKKTTEKRKTASDLLVMSKDGLTTTIQTSDAIKLFFNKANPVEAKQAAEKLRPEPEKARTGVSAKLSKNNFGRIPRTYIECLQDNTVLLSYQRKMQELTSCDSIFTLDTDHAPQLSRPLELAFILDAANKSIQ